MTDLLARLDALIAAESERQQAMRDDKPNVVDGHSDGKRVRYVRSLERESVLREVAAMLVESDR